jgi:hypothetical protein
MPVNYDEDIERKLKKNWSGISFFKQIVHFRTYEIHL